MMTRTGLLATLLLALAASTNAAQAGDKIDLCDFKLAFADDFHDLSISARTLEGRRWIAHTPWSGDFGDAVFTDPGPNGPFALKDDELDITAKRDGAGRWRSGLIAAADASGRGSGVRYGYFEARMLLPPGPGVWPAFWLSSLKPTSEPTPSVEIDVIEYYGHSDSAYSSALHTWYKGADKAKTRAVVHHTPVPAGSLVNAFHDYGVRIAPDEVTYFLDRAPVWTQPTPVELTTPMYPLVNLALGSGFPIDKTPDPSTLSVKYVHVYTYDAESRKERCPD
jgi:Glycosyl hydrolases family 16